MWQYFNTANWQEIEPHKAIGLQRTISLLRERFWVLCQFIDINETGPDCAIQRKITWGNLMDKNPARFGIVKSVYYTSEETIHLLPKDYVLDENNIPRRDFFLLAHADVDNTSTIYFLTAKMIADSFLMAEENTFSLPGSAVLNDSYLVSTKEKMLAKMEYEVQETDFVSNRLFFASRTPDWTTTLPDALPALPFKEPVRQQLIEKWQSSKKAFLLKDARQAGMGKWFTRSYLKDGFWIPEESTIFHDTFCDLIIQRKVTSMNLLNNEPPLFGIVKSWFFTPETGDCLIPRTSVMDEDNHPRKDFFFIAHSEIDRQRKVHFLSAQMIAAQFETVSIDGIEKYILPATDFLSGDKYLVTSKENMVAKMEYQLSEADFQKNRQFFSGTLQSHN
jgi:hypothetical protein